MSSAASADVDAAVDVVRTAIDFAWSWHAGDAERFGDAAGWTEARRSRSGAIWMTTNTRIPDSYARFDLEGDVIREVTFDVAEVTDPAVREPLLDAFSEAEERLIQLLGPPSEQVLGPSPKSWWRSENFTAELATSDQLVAVSLINPDTNLFWSDGGGVETPDTPHDWDTFTSSLASFLTTLPQGAKIIIDAPGNKYVQFAQGDFELYAEIAGNAFLVEPMSVEDERLLDRIGWSRPLTYGGHLGNWHRTMRWPARSDEYEELVVATTIGLRDALGIESPGELSAYGWVDGPGEVDLSALKPVIGTVRSRS
jgi:hypothetical protein